jgi:hypothetical protein
LPSEIVRRAKFAGTRELTGPFGTSSKGICTVMAVNPVQTVVGATAAQDSTGTAEKIGTETGLREKV